MPPAPVMEIMALMELSFRSGMVVLATTITMTTAKGTSER